MKAADDFVTHPPFSVFEPARQTLPYILNSPHSGRVYPDRFLAMSRLDQLNIRRSEDSYVEELFCGGVGLGIPLLAANFPRAYLDVNREAWELDPRMFNEPLPPFVNSRSARVAGGLGTIPMVVGEGRNIYSAKLPLEEAIQRINCYYKPYHARLRELVIGTHQKFGHAVLVDCHSMPSTVRVGENGIRPDFIVGDRFGTSAAASITHHAIALLRRAGYTVVHNKPYAGGFITEHYGKPAHRIHTIQLEVNRAIYMDERTYRRKKGFSLLARDLTRFLQELTELPGTYISGHPIAAE
jgi:N-formylglutamate amidohydrolase